MTTFDEFLKELNMLADIEASIANDKGFSAGAREAATHKYAAFHVALKVAKGVVQVVEKPKGDVAKPPTPD